MTGLAKHIKTIRTCSKNISRIVNEIYLLQQNFHEFSLEGLYKTYNNCWNGKLKIWSQKSNTSKSHRHNYTLLLCYPISFLESYFSCLMPLLVSNINKEKYSCFWVNYVTNRTSKRFSWKSKLLKEADHVLSLRLVPMVSVQSKVV